MSRVLVASPLGIEGALVRSAWRGARVRKTGMGTERSIAAAERLAREPADALLVMGFCGGLDPRSVPGEAIVATEVYSAADEGHAPERIACVDAERIAEMLRARGLTARSGPMVCVSRIALGGRRAQLLADGALAVEMESVWLARGAAGRPLAVVRVVLDSPSHELVRPAAVFSAVRAARVLRGVARELRDWRPAQASSGSSPGAAATAAAASATGLHGEASAG